MIQSIHCKNMSDNTSDSDPDSIDIEAIEDGDVLHIENKVGDEEEMLQVEYCGHEMVWLENDKRLFHENRSEKWTYEGIAAKVTRVHGGSESPESDLTDDGCDTPSDSR